MQRLNNYQIQSIFIPRLYTTSLEHSFTGKKSTDTSHAAYYFDILFIM